MTLRDRRAGAAVFAAVLLLLALTALAHGVLVLARQELGAATGGARHLQARAAAQAAARLVELAPLPAGADATPLWSEVTVATDVLAGAGYRAGALRVSRELWLAHGVGQVAGGAELRAARAIWVLDPVARVAGFGGVIVVGEGAPVTVAGAVDGLSVNRVEPPLEREACAPWAAALDSVFPSGGLPAVAVVAGEPDDPPRLGLLGADTVLARIPVTIAGAGTPAPVEEGGACVTEAPWSWGDPDDPTRPCGAHVAVRAAGGEVSVVGGVGQALLVVRGDLTLGGGARLYGLALVGGVLRVTEGASLTGLARARQGVEVTAGSSVTGSTCWAVRALDAARNRLGVPVSLPGSGWIGPW